MYIYYKMFINTLGEFKSAKYMCYGTMNKNVLICDLIGESNNWYM